VFGLSTRDLTEIKADFLKATKYFAVIVLSILLIVSVTAGLFYIVAQLLPQLTIF
jgi:hypothetical protein